MREGLEPPACNAVTLHVLHAGLGLALGARPVRLARARLHQTRQKARYAGRNVTVCASRLRPHDEAPGVVPEYLSRRAAEVSERGGHPVEPLALALVQERLHKGPPRVAQHRCEEVDRHLRRRSRPCARRSRSASAGPAPSRSALASAAATCSCRSPRRPAHGPDARLDASLREHLGDDNRVALGDAVAQRDSFGTSCDVEAPAAPDGTAPPPPNRRADRRSVLRAAPNSRALPLRAPALRCHTEVPHLMTASASTTGASTVWGAAKAS